MESTSVIFEIGIGWTGPLEINFLIIINIIPIIVKQPQATKINQVILQMKGREKWGGPPSFAPFSQKKLGPQSTFYLHLANEKLLPLRKTKINFKKG